MVNWKPILLQIALWWIIACPGRTQDAAPFVIQVVDQATGRGVPLVELQTIHHLRFYTDSHGVAAIAEPDLLGRRVYFAIRSHGYQFPADGFGFRGKTLLVASGGTATLTIQRTNLAERLYRVTGGGIYRDSVLLDRQVPIDHPLIGGDVFGCDSVMTALYGGRIHWFWGDTSRPHYPIGGNFHISGATSRLPAAGGLAPESGVRLDYFVGDDGGVRAMAEMPGEGPTWISAVTVLPDADGGEQMYAGYVKIRPPMESYRWGFVRWNDAAERFDNVVTFDRQPRVFLGPQTHTFLKTEADGKQYVYFANPLPLTRVAADPHALVDPSRYEGFTCLEDDTRPEDKRLDRDAQGRPRYRWKTNMPALTQKDQAMLVEAGAMQPAEARAALRDVHTGRPVMAHSGSVYWNDYRRRWVMIAVEIGGESSLLGEVWFAEADQPTGPWIYARKIVTHDQYSFYNPKHHPFFDQDEGRTIFFEGTYTHSFSGNQHPTPRYDYNQIMYRLDLTQQELRLPVAFYPATDAAAGPFAARASAGPATFCAFEAPTDATVPVVWDGTALRVGTAGDAAADALFHALPADAVDPPPTTAALYEFVDASGTRAYAIDPQQVPADYRQQPEPICRVWRIAAR